jgi:hypothetical protein
MSVSRASWLRPINKILIGLAIMAGLYIFALVISRVVLESAFGGIASSKYSAWEKYLGSNYADNLLNISGKNVVRAVTMFSEVTSFNTAEQRVQQIARQSNGFIEEFKVHRQPDVPPWLEAKLRLPVSFLDSALNSFRDLGAVKQETEASENTSAERETLSSQIELKRSELERLNSIVTRRSGSLPDTVQAEEKLAERRGELAELEKQLHGLEDRVEYALVELRIMEQYHASLDWQFAGFFSDLRNSLIDGVGTVLNSLGVVLGFLLHYGLVTFLWVGVLYLPARSLWRRYRKMMSPAEPSAA